MKRHLLDCARCWNLTHTAEFKEVITPIEKQVRSMVRKDIGIFFDQLLVHLQESDSLGDLRTVFRILLRLGGRNSKKTSALRPLPMLRKPDGSLTTTFSERQWVWMDQFAAIEAGTTMPLSELANLNMQPQGHPLDLQE